MYSTTEAAWKVRDQALGRVGNYQTRLSNGWTIKIGRGFDIYQRPDDWLQVGANDLDLRPCLETNVDVTRTSDER